MTCMAHHGPQWHPLTRNSQGSQFRSVLTSCRARISSQFLGCCRWNRMTSSVIFCHAVLLQKTVPKMPKHALPRTFLLNLAFCLQKSDGPSSGFTSTAGPKPHEQTHFEGASGQLKEGTWRHMKAPKCTWKAINQRRLALRQCLIGSFSISALLFGAYKREKQFQTWHVRTPWHLSQLHAGPLAPRGTHVLPHGLPQVLPARPYCQILPASVVVTVAFSTGVESPQSLCQLS